MLPILGVVSAVSQIAQLVPSFLKMFGEDQPPTVVTRAAEIAQSITGVLNPEEALKKLKEDDELLAKFRDAAEARAADILKAHLLDIQSARSRDVEIQRIRGSNKRADALVACCIIGIIACIGLSCFVVDLNEFGKTVVNVALGAFLGTWAQVNNFEFGSTNSSKDKDKAIASLSQQSGV